MRPTVNEWSIYVSMICGERDCEPSGVGVTFLVWVWVNDLSMTVSYLVYPCLSLDRMVSLQQLVLIKSWRDLENDSSVNQGGGLGVY